MRAVLISFVLILILLACSTHEKKPFVPQETKVAETELEVYKAPDTNSLGDDEWSRMVRYGARLVRHTSYLIGPEGKVRKSLGNKMNCTNCHLDCGTRPFGLNFFDSHRTYPQYRARENAILTMSDRVNNCITRPHNGKALPLDSKEMVAIVSYIKWVGENYDPEKHEGFGLKMINYDSLRADSRRGETVYMTHCKTCHKEDGQGEMMPDNSTYRYPPLWGPKSYQEGSSMHRVIKAARFIKYNMPNLTTTYEKPTLTDQEALDVAAFVNDGSIHPRPHPISLNYPNFNTKSIDYFKGPYADGFSEDMHTFGPWYEIEKYYTDRGLKVHR
jgi:thiosulfate dehydrogenase